MAQDPLWAPWRMEYIASDEPNTECVFCDLPRRDDLRKSLVLAAEDSFVVLMNRFPYSNGHLMVAPRMHTADLEEIDPGSYSEMMEQLRRTMKIVREVLSADGLNVGLNLGQAAGAGIADHLHWHIVPRWNGDTNFMPVLADTKVMPQHLEASYDLFRPHF